MPRHIVVELDLKATWVCHRCGFRDTLDKYYWRCPRCGSPLDIEYDFEWRPTGDGLKRYQSMLPLEPRISLGEGSTPLHVRRINGLKIAFKLEYLNPTGSFKDRGTSLAITHAVSVSAKTVVEDTSGNTGISVAAYASTANVKAKIYTPRDAPQGKKLLMKLLGAELVETKDRAEAAKKVLEEASKAYYVAHTWNPLYIEGAKTIALEAYEQGFKGKIAAAPVGSGGLILGLYRGFKQLQELEKTDVPTLVAVQGTSVHPVYEKMYGRRMVGHAESTLADGIRVPNPPRLDEIVDALRKTSGCTVLVDNNDIVDALKMLVKMGFIVEPTSAAGLAGVLKAVEEGCIDRGDEVLLPLTGSGLKMINTLYSLVS